MAFLKCNFFYGATAHTVQGSSNYWGFTITLRHSTLDRPPSGQVISPTQRHLLDNIQHSQETDIHSPAGFEPIIPPSKLPQNHPSDRAATGIGCIILLLLFLLHNALEISFIFYYIGKLTDEVRRRNVTCHATQDFKLDSGFDPHLVWNLTCLIQKLTWNVKLWKSTGCAMYLNYS
jgi:hypothetical protein